MYLSFQYTARKIEERLAAEMVRDSQQYGRKGLKQQETKNASLSFYFFIYRLLYTPLSLLLILSILGVFLAYRRKRE